MLKLDLVRRSVHLYAPSPPVGLCNLCLQLVHIPAGHVLHTDQQEEGDVEHGDVRSPPHTPRKRGTLNWTVSGILKLLEPPTPAPHPSPPPATVTQLAPTINCPLEINYSSWPYRSAAFSL